MYVRFYKASVWMATPHVRPGLLGEAHYMITICDRDES